MKLIARLLALLSVAASSLVYVKPKGPSGSLLKLFAGALAPFTALIGVVGAGLGLLANAPLALLIGTLGAVVSANEVRRVTAPQAGFEQAFGPEWEHAIALEQKTGMLPRRWTWHMAAVPAPRWRRDVPFWTIAGTDRTLLCDLWQPPSGVAPSGLALVYLHGSAWTILDKDVGTRPLFRHLAAQGHVVMDVAYRLYPETDLLGMVGDARRAIAWMKAHGKEYGVNPDRVVVGGGSAGGHLALLAAYTPADPALSPDDVRDADLSVRAVISCYGPTDLRACYYYWHQDQEPSPVQRPAESGDPANPLLRAMLGPAYDRLGLAKMPYAGKLEPLLGGTPEIVPERYAVFSPISHVHPGCPPTLLIQGEEDIITPVTATNLLCEQLVAAGVPTVNIVFPHTDHGFDLVLPRWSPPAQTALYYEERFLALMV
jgi:acetyl esterase/lipase